MFFDTIQAQKSLVLQKYLIEYTVKNAGIKSKGRFDKASAAVVFDENQLDLSRISATIQVSSFNSGITLRDNHLKAEGYFDAKNFPSITLVSTKIMKSGTANNFIGTFDLTIKNTTKSIQLPFTVIKNTNQVEFKTTEFSIDRTEFGVGKSSFTLSNTVRVAISATFFKLKIRV
ncbi:MAG: YceI family protein [Saprospiraceae bacterium]|nr:YceI family protein [Saprospiraceae bacterium]